MKFPAFFRLLNQKINKYEKAATNPFKSVHIPVTLIWVEDVKKDKN